MMTDIAETERKIAERLDPAAASALVLSKETGGLGFSNMEGAMQFAKYMAISQFAVPKHLRGNPGACLAITIQAVEWKMSPFAVANKSYLVNDRLAYESQLVQAVVLQRAPIVGRFQVEFKGDGDKRQCQITAMLKEGGGRTYLSPEIGKIPTKNSPLWKSDPDQQLFYYAGRSFCRRYFPDVLLGIYTPDELYDEVRRGPEHAKDVTPKKGPESLGLTDTGEVYANLSGAKTATEAPPIVDRSSDTISDEMAQQAQSKTAEALADPTGREATMELAMRLEERRKIVGLI